MCEGQGHRSKVKVTKSENVIFEEFTQCIHYCMWFKCYGLLHHPPCFRVKNNSINRLPEWCHFRNVKTGQMQHALSTAMIHSTVLYICKQLLAICQLYWLRTMTLAGGLTSTSSCFIFSFACRHDATEFLLHIWCPNSLSVLHFKILTGPG